MGREKQGRTDLLSVIVPCFNEEKMIETTIRVLTEVLSKNGMPYELIFVNDGSKDRTFSIVEEAAKADPGHIKGLSFSRNFGKEAAILAGLKAAAGDCAVVIDSDLQHPPECIEKMYELYLEGYDIVEGIKQQRQKESIFHRAFAKLFYSMFNRAIGMDIKDASDFKMVSRRVIDVLINMPERERFFRGLTFWTGFRMTTVVYEVRPRAAGDSKWSFKKLVKYAVQNIISFSSMPLSLISFIAAIMLVLALVFGIRALRLYIAGLAAGGITTVVMLILMTGGLILMALSIVGRYIASVYNELKARPRYLVDRTVGLSDRLTSSLEIDIDRK